MSTTPQETPTAPLLTATATPHSSAPDDLSDRWRPKPEANYPEFFMTSLADHRNFLDVSENLSKAEIRVLMYLQYASAWRYRNEHRGYIDDLASEVRHERSTVSKALSNLEALGLIAVERDRRGGPTTWQVRPGLAFCGSLQDMPTCRRRWMRRRRARRR